MKSNEKADKHWSEVSKTGAALERKNVYRSVMNTVVNKRSKRSRRQNTYTPASKLNNPNIESRKIGTYSSFNEAFFVSVYLATI